jgi:hypothetical protein
MSRRIYRRLEVPRACCVCGAPVTLARRQDRYAARKRGAAYCGRACSDRGRAANIKVAMSTPAARERLARQNRGRKRSLGRLSNCPGPATGAASRSCSSARPALMPGIEGSRTAGRSAGPRGGGGRSRRRWRGSGRRPHEHAGSFPRSRRVARGSPGRPSPHSCARCLVRNLQGPAPAPHGPQGAQDRAVHHPQPRREPCEVPDRDRSSATCCTRSGGGACPPPAEPERAHDRPVSRTRRSSP